MLDSQNSKVETTTRVGEEEAKHFYFSLTFHEQRERESFEEEEK